MLSGRLERLSDSHKIKTDKLAEKILASFATKTRKIGATPLFVYLPTLNEITDTTSGYTLEENFLKSVCDKYKIHCIFPRQRFLQAAKKGIQFKTRSHWHAPGHRVVANSIAQYLNNNKILQ